MIRKYALAGILLALSGTLNAQGVKSGQSTSPATTTDNSLQFSPAVPGVSNIPGPDLPTTITATSTTATSIIASSTISSTSKCGPTAGSVTIPFSLNNGSSGSAVFVYVDRRQFRLFVDVQRNDILFFTSGSLCKDPTTFPCNLGDETVNSTEQVFGNINARAVKINKTIVVNDIPIVHMPVLVFNSTVLLDEYFYGPPFDGVLGMGSNSIFVSALATACETSGGHGIFTGEGGSLIVGGIDAARFNNSANVTLDENTLPFTVQATLFDANGNGIATNPFTANIDSLAIRNTIPEPIYSSLFTPSLPQRIAFQIQNSTEYITMTNISPTDFLGGNSSGLFTFGKPFLQAAYFAYFPDGTFSLGSANSTAITNAPAIVSVFPDPSGTRGSAPTATEPSSSSSLSSGVGNSTSLVISKKSNAGAIAGGVIGGLVVIFLLLGACFFLRHRRRSARGRSNSPVTPMAGIKREINSPYAPVPPPAPYTYTSSPVVGGVEATGSQDSRYKLMEQSPVEREIRNSHDDGEYSGTHQSGPGSFHDEPLQAGRIDDQLDERSVVEDPRTAAGQTLRSPSPDFDNSITYGNVVPEAAPQPRGMAPRLPFKPRPLGGNGESAL